MLPAAARPVLRQRRVAASSTSNCGLRQLSLVFGVTVHAVATVLAAFFSGLALGSFLAGRYADRTHRPLRTYGAIEIILVGLLALLTPAGLKAVESLYVDLARQLPDSTASPHGCPLCCCRSRCWPCRLTLLGASLPMIIKSSLVRSCGLGAKVSLLYANQHRRRHRRQRSPRASGPSAATALPPRFRWRPRQHHRRRGGLDSVAGRGA